MARLLDFTAADGVAIRGEIQDEDGTFYTLQVRWFERLQGWYVDVLDYRLMRRLSAGGIIARLPSGSVLAGVGRDRYVQEDLGVNVFVGFVGASEIV